MEYGRGPIALEEDAEFIELGIENATRLKERELWGSFSDSFSTFVTWFNLVVESSELSLEPFPCF